MLVSDSRRFLFVHVQKTGGAAIDRALREALPDTRRVKAERHATLAAILKVEPELAGYWIVGFVRNPWSRMLSWYRMIDRFRARAANGERLFQEHLATNPFLATTARDYADFESFVMHATEAYGRLRTPQHRYLTDPAGRRADFVGRQETLEDDVRALFARLDVAPVDLPVINIDRARPDYRDVYTEPMRARVAELFARDLAAFGYRY